MFRDQWPPLGELDRKVFCKRTRDPPSLLAAMCLVRLYQKQDVSAKDSGAQRVVVDPISHRWLHVSLEVPRKDPVKELKLLRYLDKLVAMLWSFTTT
jgi:hypothetical protein